MKNYVIKFGINSMPPNIHGVFTLDLIKTIIIPAKSLSDANTIASNFTTYNNQICRVVYSVEEYK